MFAHLFYNIFDLSIYILKSLKGKQSSIIILNFLSSV